MTRHHTYFPLLPLIPQSKPQGSPLLLPPGCTNSLPSPSTHQQKYFKVYLYNQENLKNLYNQSINVQVTIQNITKEGRLCMKSPAPEAQFAESFFLPSYDLIINPPCRTGTPLPPNKLFSICYEKLLEKDPSIPYGWTPCPCSTGKSCWGICSHNICKEVQTKAC